MDAWLPEQNFDKVVYAQNLKLNFVVVVVVVIVIIIIIII
jgi:hypothetical protein